MNEHTIREIARVSHEAHRAYCGTALGLAFAEFDSLSDDDMDDAIEFTRVVVEHLAQNPNYVPKEITKKVRVAVIKALVASHNLV